MSQSLKSPAPSSPPASSGAGTAPVPLLTRLLARPELGALIAAIAIYIFFFIVAPAFRSPESLSTILYASSTIGIVAVGVGLLMIGGEFDLSAGVASITYGVDRGVVLLPVDPEHVGRRDHVVVVRVVHRVHQRLFGGQDGDPVFLVTLGTFFVLQGANLGVTKLMTGSVASQNVADIDGFDTLKAIFASSFTIGSVTVRITVIWWILFVAIASWTLTRTRIGNWIYAVGGNAASARAVGVPVNRVKIGLFMCVAFLAWFYGMHRLFGFNTSRPVRASVTSSCTSSPPSSVAPC